MDCHRDGTAFGSLSSVRLELLEAFVAVSEDLHFTHAAARLYLSQPGLSRRISQLEAALGAELFSRGSTHALSPAGHALLPHARIILRTATTAARAVAAAQTTNRPARAGPVAASRASPATAGRIVPEQAQGGAPRPRRPFASNGLPA